jgi:WD40 repeat protein
LGRCLYELKRISEAALCLKYFKSQFPHHIKSDLCKSLDEDVSRAVAAEEKAAASKENAPSTSKDAPSTSSVQGSSRSTAPTPTAADFLRRLDDASAVRRVVFRADEDNDDGNEDEDSLLESDVQPMEDSNRAPSSDSNSSEPSASSRNQERSPRKPDFHEHESSLREQAVDFSERFCGHCNTTTDIKEASFFGGYIVAGSDDGSFYIWERKTTNIVKIVKGDESIVNCLQPHPSTCMLATSGIETVVRLWSPMPEVRSFYNLHH